MYLVAQSLQGSAIVRHELRGGQRDSGWVAAGIGLLCGIAVLSLVFGVAIVIAA